MEYYLSDKITPSPPAPGQMTPPDGLTPAPPGPGSSPPPDTVLAGPAGEVRLYPGPQNVVPEISVGGLVGVVV